MVDDGSRDQTAEIVRAFAANHPPKYRLLQNPGNHGKGYSVRNGILHSFGEIVMFTDADLSAPIEEAEGLFAAIAAGADIAIGSRWLERTRQTIRQPFYRQFFGRCFNAVTRVIMGLPFADTQCGFKAFTRAAAQTVFQLQTIERWGFDPEILFIALKRGYRINEVPVSWAHDERTRISYLKDGMRMLRTSPSSAGTPSSAATTRKSSASTAPASSSSLRSKWLQCCLSSPYLPRAATPEQPNAFLSRSEERREESKDLRLLLIACRPPHHHILPRICLSPSIKPPPYRPQKNSIRWAL